MSKGRDFIPGSDGQFLEWSGVFCTAAAAHTADLGVPAGVITDLNAKRAAFVTAYTASQAAGRSKLDIAVKNQTRDGLKAAIRSFKKTYLDPRNDLADVVWEEFGLTPPDKVRSPIETPKSRPVFTAAPTKVTREILIEFYDSATGKKAIPYGCNGALVAWQVGGPAPTDQDQLIHTKLLTTHREILTFTEAERGQTVYLALCYQSKRGNRGPWTEIQTIIVP